MSTSRPKGEGRTLGTHRFRRRLLIVVLLTVLTLTAVRGWSIYQKGIALYNDATALRGMLQSSIERMDPRAVEIALMDLRADLDSFTHEAKPVLWLAPKLGWAPVYGNDLAQTGDLMELAGGMVDASLLSVQASKPLLDEINSPESALSPAGLTALLVDAQPRFLEARRELDRALDARNRIEVEQLSPRLQELVKDELDPLLQLMDDGLSLTTTLPVILGAAGDGPKTYLVLVQNEDELRPTGGFITTVGTLTVSGGEIVNLEFEGVDALEDWSRPYPSAPWQLQEYMNTSVLILRDSNWYADFPTSAVWAEYLYSYNHADRMDGVIAFDQQFLVMVLGVLGPLEVEGAPYAITSENAVEYMRSAKQPPAGEPIPSGWYRKEFIRDIANAVLQRFVNGEITNWRDVATVLERALDERHLLFQFDDPAASSLLEKHDWDNAIHPIEGDFLMVTDTNIGFNKTNALMDIHLSYDVDLSDLSAPLGSLLVTHRNASREDVQCIHFDAGRAPEDYLYPMERCYWTYLRVYKQSGIELIDSSPHSVPGEWMLLGKAVPARVDLLEEEADGVQGFGTLLVVPGGGSLATGFEFALPAAVVSLADETGVYVYRLKVQKQPGTLANPLVIRVHLPSGSKVETVNADALVQDGNLLIERDLRTDVYLELFFHVP